MPRNLPFSSTSKHPMLLATIFWAASMRLASGEIDILHSDIISLTNIFWLLGSQAWEEFFSILTGRFFLALIAIKIL